MSANTGIQWTDATWNPVVGCERVSPGCDNCYAKALHDMRHKARKAGKQVLPLYDLPFESVQMRPKKLEEPLHWRKPRRVFVNSMSDLFHKDVPEDFLDRVFAVMALADRQTFQILTKRPARMRKYLRTPDLRARIAIKANAIMRESRTNRGFGHALTHRFLWREIENALPGEYCNRLSGIADDQWPLPNVWLGVSVENQACADKRIPMLMETPAAVRFLSCEPLLGPLELAIDDIANRDYEGRYLDWLIVGGESGPNARVCRVEWIEDILAQADEFDVPVFVKQLGKWIEGDHLEFLEMRWLCSDGRVFIPPIIGEHTRTRPASAIAFSLADSHGGNPTQWPERLRVRRFPEEATSCAD